MSTALATIAAHRDSILKFDKLGGSDSVWGRKHVFEEMLKEAHEEAGETDKGMYCFKKMGWYGNIVSYTPTLVALKKFLALGYTMKHVAELEEIYAGGHCRGAIDEVTLAAYLRVAAELDDLDEAIALEQKAQNKEDG